MDENHERGLKLIAPSDIIKLNGKQKDALNRIFKKPPLREMPWKDVISLFEALGADIEEKSGSKTRILLGGRVFTCDAPHNPSLATGGLIVRVRKFLEEIGAKP